MSDVKYPALLHAAEAASGSGQGLYLGYIRADLVLILVAALMGGLSSVGPDNWRQACAVLAALAIASAAIFRGANRAQRPHRAWFDGRAVAESVKTTTWRYMMRTQPFAGDDAHADRRFVAELREIVAARRDLKLEAGSDEGAGGQITEFMRNTRSLPFAERKSLYIEKRATDQVGWYSSRSAFHRRRAKIWFLIGFGAELLALLWAISRAVAPATVNLIGFLSTVAAGATAFVQLQSHDELARSYGLAAQELSLIETLIRRCTDEAEFNELVKNSEGAISREHTMWIAKRG